MDCPALLRVLCGFFYCYFEDSFDENQSFCYHFLQRRYHSGGDRNWNDLYGESGAFNALARELADFDGSLGKCRGYLLDEII